MPSWEQDARLQHPRFPDRNPTPAGAACACAQPTTCPLVGDAGMTGGHPSLCERCDAVCCRLTVVLQPEDRIPAHLTTHTAAGLHVMARDAEGWCVAVDGAHMHCSIYGSRPQVCRRFVMAGPYCREIRSDYTDRNARGIPLEMY